MITLGSCTMKLNATSEMIPITWPEFANMHPFAPKDQTKGYLEMIRELNSYLANLTDFAAVSTQPNVSACGATPAKGETQGILSSLPLLLVPPVSRRFADGLCAVVGVLCPSPLPPLCML